MGEDDQRSEQDPVGEKLQKIMQNYPIPQWAVVVIIVLAALAYWVQGRVSAPVFCGIPVFSAAEGLFSLGLVATDTVAVGLIGFGVFSVGVVAMGCGALGLVSLGVGAVGFIAVGYGAVGYIAIGPQARGVYVLAEIRGVGTHVLNVRDPQQRDQEAVRFFCKYLPRLREAFPAQQDAS